MFILKKLDIKLILWIALVILVITRILHKIQMMQKISEGDTVGFTYQIGTYSDNCLYSYQEYSFLIPRCRQYNELSKLKISGKVTEVTDKLFLKQKRLKVQEISQVQNNPVSVKSWKNLIFSPIKKLRLFFLKKILILWSEPYGSLIAGFVFGFEQKLPEDFLYKIKVTGMQHVVVASGFNVSLVAIVADKIFSLVGFKRSLKFIMLCSSIMIYCLISGLSAPLTRALFMGIMSLTAKNIFFRQYNPLFAIFLSSVIMLLINPLYIFSISFQLTVAATLGVILVYPLIGDGAGIIKNLMETNLSDTGSKISSSLLTMFHDLFLDSFFGTLAANSLTLPILLYHFQEFSLMSFVANSALLFLTPLITYLGFLTLLIALILENFKFLENLIVFPLSLITFLPVFAFVKGIEFFGQFDSLLLKTPDFDEKIIFLSLFFVLLSSFLSFLRSRYEA